MANGYLLEIYEPKSIDTLLFSLSSDTAFPRFEKGDEIRHLYSFGNPEEINLVVDRVQYLVWQGKLPTFKTLVYTKERFEGESNIL